MDPRAKSLFLDVLDGPPAARRQRAAEGAAGEESLLRVVLGPLDAHERLERTGGDAATSTVATDSLDLAPGATVGSYELVERVGEAAWGPSGAPARPCPCAATPP